MAPQPNLCCKTDVIYLIFWHTAPYLSGFGMTRLLFLLLCAAVFGAWTVAYYPGLPVAEMPWLPKTLHSGATPSSHPLPIYYAHMLLPANFPLNFALYLVAWSLYWIAAYLLVTASSRHLLIRVCYLALLLCPPVLLVMLYRWQDALLLASLLFTAAALQQFSCTRRMLWAVIALLALCLSASFFYISFVAVVPLIWIIFYLLPRQRSMLVLPVKVVLMLVLLTGGLHWLQPQHAQPVSLLPAARASLPHSVDVSPWLVSAWGSVPDGAALPEPAHANGLAEKLTDYNALPAIDGWLWLMPLAATTLLFGLMQRGNMLRSAALALCMSGWLTFALILWLDSNAPMRFMAWPVACGLVTLMWVRLPRRLTGDIRKLK